MADSAVGGRAERPVYAIVPRDGAVPQPINVVSGEVGGRSPSAQCGDGTGHAIREAILACAIIRSNETPAELHNEYRLRLQAGFRRHLEHCRQFYATGGASAWWQSELAELDRGLEWIAQQPAAPLGRYRLRGFELETKSDKLAF